MIVYPQARVIRLIQDKGLQKQFFKQNDIPTAAFQLVKNLHEETEDLPPLPFIQKLRKDGYDGRGVKRIAKAADLEEAFSEPSLIEEWIDFEQEIAVIVARNDDGETATFPMVEMEFNVEANLVEFLISPSVLSFEVQQKAEELARKVADDLQIVGLLAVEMFLTKEGEILVNELAPRPHNSGHHTIEGNFISQFEQHMRAIFNLPLGNTEARTNAVMINLLGEEGYEGPALYEGVEEVMTMDGVYIHLYGKKFTRPFRKMGHVCIVNDDREVAIEKARKVQEILKVKA